MNAHTILDPQLVHLNIFIDMIMVLTNIEVCPLLSQMVHTFKIVQETLCESVIIL